MHDDYVIEDENYEDDNYYDEAFSEIYAIVDDLKSIIYNSLSLLNKSQIGSVGYQLSSMMTLVEIIENISLESIGSIGVDEEDIGEYGAN